MHVYILTLKVNCNIKWNCSIKERRQIAQKINQIHKNAYNGSVKIVYLENNRAFEMYYVLLGESRDYLMRQFNFIDEYYEVFDGLSYSIEYDINMW